jgi:hypothetical protein
MDTSEVRGNITTRLTQICAYADDSVISGRTKQIWIEIFCKLKNEAQKAGLIINNNKTKYLYCTRRTGQPTYLDTREEQFEQTNSLKYLASIEEEIKERTVAVIDHSMFTNNYSHRN